MLISTFNLQGGIELGGIYVKTMAPEGPAALSGKINIGASRNQYFFSSSSSSSSIIAKIIIIIIILKNAFTKWSDQPCPQRFAFIQ